MQNNRDFYYSGFQESSDSLYSEIAPVNSAAFVDVTPMLTYTGVPVDLHEWPSAVASITGNNNDGSLTAVSGIAENFGHAAVSYHQAVSDRTPIPLTIYDYSAYPHSRSWRSAAVAVTADAYAPQTAWNERSAAFTRLNRSQVPSGLTYLDAQRGDNRHAVGAPIRPTFLRDTDYFRHPMPVSSYLPALPEVSASSMFQAHTAGLGNVGPCVPVPMPGRAPPPSNHRRHHHPLHARPEHVICNQCKKPMCRQSLRRHVREVHDHIKRPHSKSRLSSFSAGP